MESCENSRKRRHSVIENILSNKKKPRMMINNEDFEFPSDLHEELLNVNQNGLCIPHHLIELMYQLDLSLLCSLKMSRYEYKYPSLSLGFEDSGINKFNIVFRNKKKSIHIQIENIDKPYVDNDISYARLFSKERRRFSINSYFDYFVKHLIAKLDGLAFNIKYLVIFTNSGLSITEENKFKEGQSRNFYPLKFDFMNLEEYGILKDLFTSDNTQVGGFYHFSQDKITREEVSKRLEFSSAVLKVIKERNLSQEEIKQRFLDKLVFAVNQPDRQELNSIIKTEIEKNSKLQYEYIELQEKLLHVLTDSKTNKRKLVLGIVYEFNLLISFLYDMFLQKNIYFINSKSYGISNDVIINYKGRITYIKTYNADTSNIGYSQLFPSSAQEKKNKFSINKLFTIFVEGLNDYRYFIIYTNAGLDLTEENRLKKGQSRDFFPLKFDSIDIQRKRYKILRYCSCINDNGLYQFAQEEATKEKLFSLLRPPLSLQSERGLSNEYEKEIKDFFLKRLIFAVHQPNKEKLSNILKMEIDDKSNKIQYSYEGLHEIALRWLESHDFDPITKETMEKLFEDITNNRFNGWKSQNKNIYQELEFAKSVVGREGTFAFYQFIEFLIKGEGIKYLEILKRKEIKLTNMSTILHGAGIKSIKAFKDLFDLWFDGNGSETQYLKTLEKEGINLSNMSGILSGSACDASKAFKDLYDLWFDSKGNRTQYLKPLEQKGLKLANISSILGGVRSNAAEAFKDLYDIWFDRKGNKTQYLKTLEKQGVNFSNMSSILSRAGGNAVKAFKDLFDLWFDEEGNKTQYLKTLEEEEISLTNMSSILSSSGSNAANAFKDLYDLWFDRKGNKTQYLKTLEEQGINLTNMSGILNGAGGNAVKAFIDLYDLWFERAGNKTQYLKTLEEEGINLNNVSSILSGAGGNAAKAFKGLYDLWFDGKGNKTHYLRTLEEEGINLTNMSGICSGARGNAAKAFKGLYDLWFDGKGNKTVYLKTLKEEGINLTNVSSILNGARGNAAKAFKGLYDLWFDRKGNKTQYLKTLEEEGINLTNMSSILSGAGDKAAKAFKDLYDLWFDREGNKTQYLKTLEEKRIKLTNMSSILNGAGDKAAKAFKDLYDLWFDREGNKTEYLKTLEKGKINITNMSSIVSGARRIKLDPTIGLS